MKKNNTANGTANQAAKTTKPLSNSPDAIRKRNARAQAKAAKTAAIATPTPTIAPIVPTAPIDTKEAISDASNGDSEATQDAIVTDMLRGAKQAGDDTASTVLATAGVVAWKEDEDTLTCTPESGAWNSTAENTFPTIGLRGPNNVLARFDYIPTPLTLNGVETPFSMLACSDTHNGVGKPFAQSYGLITNNDFLNVIEQIGAVLDTLGLKWSITTTGTLYNRERQFLSIKINHEDKMTVDGREFHAFLNCLNSIPSNTGCTVTFANNTFCVCCRNTFAHCLQGADGAKFHAAIKHSKKVKAILQDVPKLVELYLTNNQTLFKQLKHFQQFPVGLVDAENYFAAFLGRDKNDEMTDKTEFSTRAANTVDELTKLFANGKGNKGETALDVFQAVTEYYTHFSAGENKAKQWLSSEAGNGLVNKVAFYQWLVRATQAKANFDAVARVGNTLLVNYRKK